jgi:hypothetical protein
MDEKEYATKLARLEQLMDASTYKEEEELETLSGEIEAYENEHFQIFDADDKRYLSKYIDRKWGQAILAVGRNLAQYYADVEVCCRNFDLEIEISVSRGRVGRKLQFVTVTGTGYLGARIYAWIFNFIASFTLNDEEYKKQWDKDYERKRK